MQVAQVASQLVSLLIPIDSIEPHPDNYNDGDVNSVAESLETFTQYIPLVVQDSTNLIVKGNTTWQSAKRLGWTHIAAVSLPLSDIKAKAILLGDNRHARRAKWDDDALVALLAEVAGADALTGTGYDGGDLDKLLLAIEQQTHDPASAASGFLDTFLGASGESNAPSIPDQPVLAERPSDRYVQITFVATFDQREAVYAAIKHAASIYNVDKQIDALVLISQEYIRAHS